MYQWIAIGAVCFLGVLSIITNALYNKYSDNCTKYTPISIAIYFLTVLNFATDILTAFVMVEYYYTKSTYGFMSSILALATLITIIIPYVLNCFLGLKNTKSSITFLSIFLNGDAFTSLKLNKNKTLCKPAKWITILCQNLPQIAIQATFMIHILKTVDIIFIISISISLIVIIEGLISFRHKISNVRNYSAKLQFNVLDLDRKSMKKNKLNKHLKQLLCVKLTDALLITKDMLKIGPIIFDENNVEIEIIHSIPHEIGNDIEYVSNMYHNQMDKIGNIISQVYEIYNTENIKPTLITDKSSALMIMNSTSFRSIPMVSTPSNVELDALNKTTESQPDEQQIMNENDSAEKHENNDEENSQAGSKNSNEKNENENEKEEYVNPDLWDTKDTEDVDI